jgi:hypothetical protein
VASKLKGDALTSGSRASTAVGACSCSPCALRLCLVAATAKRSKRPALKSPAAAELSWLLGEDTLNLFLPADWLRCVIRGIRERAPSSVAFSTSQSARPPLRVRQPTARTHSGPVHGSVCGSCTAETCKAAEQLELPLCTVPAQPVLNSLLRPRGAYLMLENNGLTAAEFLSVYVTMHLTTRPLPSHSSTASLARSRRTRTACFASSGSSSMQPPTTAGSCAA